jgi:hypothetical protein
MLEPKCRARRAKCRQQPNLTSRRSRDDHVHPGEPGPAGCVIAPFRTHTYMVAVHGDLAVAVYVDVKLFGAGTAGPILK